MIESLPAPPPRPSLSFTVAWTVFALLTFLVVGGTAQMMQLAWGLWFSEIVVFAGLAVIGFQLSQLEPRRAMGLQRFAPRAFGQGFAFGLINYVAWAVPLMALAQAIFPKWMVEKFDSAQVFERATPVELAIVLIGVSLAAPLGEELFFRGFLQRGLGLHHGAPRAIVVTALVFSIFHLDPVGLAARFELGVLFGLLAWRGGSLWPAIGAHSANNLISSVLFLAAGEAKEDELVWWVPVSMFVLGNLALVAMLRSTRGRLEVSEPMALVAVEGPAATPGRLFAPWVLAGAVSVGVVLAFDSRGVRLNLLDAQLQPGKVISKREEVRAVRARARRGEVELGEYERVVRAMKGVSPHPD